MKEVSVSDKHQIKIAKSTLKMHDAGAMIMGGMTKDEARRVLKKAGYSDRQIAQMEESTMSKNIFEIKEEVKIGNIILEKGDRIQVLDEDEEKEFAVFVSTDPYSPAIDSYYYDTYEQAERALRKLSRDYSSTFIARRRPNGEYTKI